jgi:hypothetical protein
MIGHTVYVCVVTGVDEVSTTNCMLMADTLLWLEYDGCYKQLGIAGCFLFLKVKTNSGVYIIICWPLIRFDYIERANICAYC